MSAIIGKSESVRDSASTIIASSLPLTLAVVVRMSRGAIGAFGADMNDQLEIGSIAPMPAIAM